MNVSHHHANTGHAGPSHLNAAEIARIIGRGCVTRHISDLIYKGRLDLEKCPMIGRRRLIAVDYIPTITAALERAGRLEPVEETVGA